MVLPGDANIDMVQPDDGEQNHGKNNQPIALELVVHNHPVL